jgi:hypothetical protein
MRSRLLRRHFISQFVENDLSPDMDRHQLLALAAAGLVTLPLFATVFMSVKYLMQPLQSPGWTQVTAMGDQLTFCATSLLVSAIIATLEWDALALSPRDAMILGVLPVPHREIVDAKIRALVTFAGAFVISLNALPTLLHPPLMVANFQGNPLLLIPLILAHGVSTCMAGAFGFTTVVGLREFLFLCLGEYRLSRIAGTIRSGLLFSFLVLLVLVPIRLSGRPNWMFEAGGGSVLVQPVSWFAATHGAIAGRVIDMLPTPVLPERLAVEEERLRTQYRASLPRLTGLAIRGTGVLAALMTFSLAIYLRNARRLQVVPERGGPGSALSLSHITDAVASAIAWRPSTRAGFLFFVRTLMGSPPHRIYITASVAVGMAVLITLAPDVTSAEASQSDSARTFEIAAQTLLLTILVAGFRAAVRTSADPRAAWTFGVAETGTLSQFRAGVRRGMIAAMLAAVGLLLPLHAAAWGLPVALMHAVNGCALGWLLVEAACASVEQPLVQTIPPSDGLNTVGVVLLGALVIVVLVLSRIEVAALNSTAGVAAFAGGLLFVAACLRHVNEQNHRAAALAAIAASSSLPTSSPKY